MKKLLIVIPYFGQPVPWLQFFLASCAKNPEIDWMLVTDFGISSRPRNVHHTYVSFEDYKRLIEQRLDLSFSWNEAYKLCDLKPALGLVHSDWFENYEFWGYGDIDLIYGNILEKYEPLMRDFDIISSHTHNLAGHLSIFRNIPETKALFRFIKGWQLAFCNEKYQRFDEGHMSLFLMPYFHPQKLFFAPIFKCGMKVGSRELNILFKEQHTTFMGRRVLPDGTFAMPSKWVWRNGDLHNDLLRQSIIYSHFSYWNSGRYGDTRSPEAGIWRRNPNTSFPSANYDEITGFTLDKAGFHLLD